MVSDLAFSVDNLRWIAENAGQADTRVITSMHIDVRALKSILTRLVGSVAFTLHSNRSKRPKK